MNVKEIDDNIFLVGVDYLGDESLDLDLMALVEKYEPEIVGLALCEKRFETLEAKEQWLERPLLPSYKTGDVGTLIYQTFVESIRENLRKFKDIEPEVNVADLVDLADLLDIEIRFIDRDVTLTFKRAFSNMKPLEKLKMVWYFRSAMLSFSEDKKFNSIEGMERKDDMVEGILSSLDNFAPEVAEKIREERIEYMAKKIYESSKNKKILNILPQSKIEILEEKLKELKEDERDDITERYSELDKVGKKVYKKALHYTPHVLLITFAVYLFFFTETLNVWQAWLYWIISVGGMSAIGSAMVKGHPISIILSFLLAPIMSLTLHGPGWVAGYVEARVREPRIRDIQELTESSSMNEFFTNNLIRPIMVGVFSNVFTWIGLFVVLPLMISIF